MTTTFSVAIDWDNDGSFIPLNKAVNSDFSSGETGWSFAGGITHSVSGGKLNVLSVAGSEAFYQDIAYAVNAGNTAYLSFKVANSAATERQIIVVIDPLGIGNEYEIATAITIPAGTSEYTEILSGIAGTAWSTTRITFYVMTASATPGLTFDDIHFWVDIGEDITAFVRDTINIRLGFYDPLLIERRSADAGRCSIIVDNTDKRFTPLHTSGSLYGRLLPNLPVRVQATDGVTTWTVFYGLTKSITPEPGTLGQKRAFIEATDVLGVLADAKISLPLQEDRTADYLLKLIGSAVYKTARATGTITLSAVPSANDTVTVGGSTYVFKASLTGAANEVFIGSDAAVCAALLALAINAGEGAGSYYGNATPKNTYVSASASGGTVTVTALARGAWGNGVNLSASGATLSVSGAYLTGGVDGPASMFSYEGGRMTFNIAADQWSTDRTSALDAAEDATRSEWGLFWAARNGTLTFKNKDWLFKRAGEAVALECIGTAHDLIGGLSIDQVFNRIKITYRPAVTGTAGSVVAKGSGIISVPGTWGTDRYNPSDDMPMGGSYVLTLPFVDGETGQVGGAKSLLLPPTPTTDYTVNDVYDGTGYNYTSSNVISFAAAITGSGVELTIKNSALGKLYISGLQIRGTPIYAVYPQQMQMDDTTSQTAYGVRSLTVDLPLSSTLSTAFTRALAEHLLGKHKTPSYRVTGIRFDSETVINGVNLLSLEIGDVIKLTEDQTSVSNRLHMISGIQYEIPAGGGDPFITFGLHTINDSTYWLLGNATYGKLGSTTRLAL